MLASDEQLGLAFKGIGFDFCRIQCFRGQGELQWVTVLHFVRRHPNHDMLVVLEACLGIR